MQPQNRKHFKVKGVHMKKKKITAKSIHHNEAGDAFFYHNGQYESVENQTAIPTEPTASAAPSLRSIRAAPTQNSPLCNTQMNSASWQTARHPTAGRGKKEKNSCKNI